MPLGCRMLLRTLLLLDVFFNQALMDDSLQIVCELRPTFCLLSYFLEVHDSRSI